MNRIINNIMFKQKKASEQDNERNGVFGRWSIPSMLCPLLLTAIGYVISIVAFALNGRTILDADEAAEMVLASHLNQTGRFLSEDWYYSTELRVLNTQIINKFALALFPDNWHAARTLAVAILVFILLASYIYLIQAAKLGRIGILTSLALVVPFSTQYSYVVLYGSFYVPHIAITFVLLALTLKTLECSSNKGAGRKTGSGAQGSSVEPALYFTAACILSFIAGLGGVRQFLVFHAPLFLASFLMLLFSTYSKDSLTDILTGMKGRLFLYSIAESFFCMLGVAVNSAVMHRFYTFEEYTKVSLNSISLSSFWEYLDSVFHLWGYEGCVELRDITGAAALCGLTLCTMYLILLGFLIRKINSLNVTQQLLLYFFLVGLMVNTLFYLLANNPMPRFLMPAAVMIFPLIPVIMNLRGCFGKPWRILILTVFVCCLLIQSVNYFWYYAFRDKGKVKTAEEQVVSWLEDNGYDQGYSTFWNGSNLTELSDGKIEIWGLTTDSVVSDWSECRINEWLQVKSHMTSQPEGTVFLLLDDQEVEEAGSLPFEEEPAYSERGYCVWIFDSADELFRPR